MAKDNSEELEKITIPLASKQAVLILTQYDTIDSDDITSIQHHNIMGEILTCSTVLNRIGNLRADAESIYSELKLDLEVYQAQRDEELRTELIKEVEDSKGNIKTKSPTNPEVENAIKRSAQYRIKMKSVIRAKKTFEIIDSLYWAVKDKNKRLDRLSSQLVPEDFEKQLTEGVVNGIQIKMTKKFIDGK